MPQLNLSWFFINFSISWSLLIITWTILINQNWYNINTSNQKPLNTNNNTWNW